MTRASRAIKGILPPKGLLIALAFQLPLALASWPWRPSTFELAAGLFLLAAGATLNVWAERLFRRASVGVCPFSPVPTVIESGPYRLTRNPMYLGLVAITLSAALMSGVPLNAWTACALWMWLHYKFVLPEESFLARELGERYLDYARRVPRWLIVQSPPVPSGELPVD